MQWSLKGVKTSVHWTPLIVFNSLKRKAYFFHWLSLSFSLWVSDDQDNYFFFVDDVCVVCKKSTVHTVVFCPLIWCE